MSVDDDNNFVAGDLECALSLILKNGPCKINAPLAGSSKHFCYHD